MPLPQPKRIAIIGGGCTGVTSFWALQHSVHDVHLFEASFILGGRVKTLPLESEKEQVHVNTESPYFNADASPNFVALLRCLGIPTTPTPLDFGVSYGADTCQWQCSVLGNVPLRPSSLFNLETCRILFDLVRLKYLVLDVLMDRPNFNLECSGQKPPNACEYLSNEGFSDTFRDKFLVPLLSTLWGTNAGRFLPRLSIKALAHVLHDHRVLSIRESVPEWRHINKSASHFIQRMADGFCPGKVHLGTRVQGVYHGVKSKYNLRMSNEEKLDFDHIIFAVDSQETLRLVKAVVNSEVREILQDIQTTKNIAVLHSDSLLMPNPRIATPYTTIIPSNNNPNISKSSSSFKSSLAYNLNALQTIPPNITGPISITINPFTPPHPCHAQAVWEYTDAEISTQTLTAQRSLQSIQQRKGKHNGLIYAFAASPWTGRGFFEDTVSAGLAVAVGHLGAKLPFPVVFHYHHGSGSGPVLGLRDHLVLTGLGVVRVYVRVLELLVALMGVFWGWLSRRYEARKRPS